MLPSTGGMQRLFFLVVVAVGIGRRRWQGSGPPQQIRDATGMARVLEAVIIVAFGAADASVEVLLRAHLGPTVFALLTARGFDK